MQKIGYLFVYGSLRSGFNSPAYHYVSQYFSLISKNATVNGCLIDLGQYPVAIPHAGFTIKGELYKINFEDEFGFAIAQLDDYEGVCTEEGEKQLYRRDVAVVTYEQGKVPAWVYWYCGNDVAGKPIIESGDVLAYLAQKNK